MMRKRHIVIVGGGASGFFCAANIDVSKYDVTIIEQSSEVMQKIKVSGGGRCNVTNACFDAKILTGFYPRGYKELLGVFSKFSPKDTIEWFAKRQVSIKRESDNRCFPTSNNSQTIIDCLYSEAIKRKVNIKTQASVKAIKKIENDFEIITNKEVLRSDYVVWATGSSPKSLDIMMQLGHSLVPPVPSLFTFNIKDSLLEGLMGLCFPDVSIKIKELKAEENGALLITHWGISGPAVLKLSAWQARNLHKLQYQFEATINFINSSKEGALIAFETYKSIHSKKSMGQCKIFDLPNRFWIKALEVSMIDSQKQISQINKKEINKLLETLCNKEFQVKGKSIFKEEFVTAGGINLKEIDFKTMQSKVCEHLYCCGEVLDIDAITGGFNFQACWSEAWLIAQDLNSKT